MIELNIKFDETGDAGHEAGQKSGDRFGGHAGAIRNALRAVPWLQLIPGRVRKLLVGRDRPPVLDAASPAEAARQGYHSVTGIAGLLGIYTGAGRPHGNAVSAIISTIEDAREHAVIVPHDFMGGIVCYDHHVISAVCDWLSENGEPDEIPYLDYHYHVHYGESS